MLNRRTLLSTLVSAIGVMCLSLSACTVEPLYGERNSPVQVNSVAVAMAKTRVEQQVRNRLLFLLNGSGAVPDSPKYEARISVLSTAESVVSGVRTVRLRMAGRLEIRGLETGDVLKSFARTKFSSLDTNSQSFANKRALIDAENRAAAELAEDFRVLIASFVSAQ